MDFFKLLSGFVKVVDKKRQKIQKRQKRQNHIMQCVLKILSGHEIANFSVSWILPLLLSSLIQLTTYVSGSLSVKVQVKKK